MTSGRIDDPERLRAVRRSALIDTDPEVVSRRSAVDGDGVLLGTEGLVDTIGRSTGSVAELVDRIRQQTVDRGGLADDALVLAFGLSPSA